LLLELESRLTRGWFGHNCPTRDPCSEYNPHIGISFQLRYDTIREQRSAQRSYRPAGHCNGNQDLVHVLGDELDSSVVWTKSEWRGRATAPKLPQCGITYSNMVQRDQSLWTI